MPESLQQALQNLSTAITSAGAVEDFLYAGGPVLLVIFALTLALWFLIAQRFWFFAVQSKPYNLQTLGQWRSLPEHQSWSAHATRDMLLSQARVQYNGALGTIRTLINIAPLLGLLGTVSGMIEVFDVIAFSGSSNVQAMAAGISKCILSTMAGLVVAISGLYFIAVLQRCSDHAIGKLSQQMQTSTIATEPTSPTKPTTSTEPTSQVQYAS